LISKKIAIAGRGLAIHAAGQEDPLDGANDCS
jgi:hypothetical protein